MNDQESLVIDYERQIAECLNVFIKARDERDAANALLCEALPLLIQAYGHDGFSDRITKHLGE